VIGCDSCARAVTSCSGTSLSATAELARRHTNEEFYISPSRLSLSDFEGLDHTPSIYKLYSLCDPGVSYTELLLWYGIDAGCAASRGLLCPGTTGSVLGLYSHGLHAVRSKAGMQMSSRLIVGVVALSIATSAMIMANLFLYIMIGEINRRREEGNLISYFGFAYPKTKRIFDEYRTLYPNGKMHIYALTAFAVAMAGLIAFAVCLRIIG
jgi:hypothetical protein